MADTIVDIQGLGAPPNLSEAQTKGIPDLWLVLTEIKDLFEAPRSSTSSDATADELKIDRKEREKKEKDDTLEKNKEKGLFTSMANGIDIMGAAFGGTVALGKKMTKGLLNFTAMISLAPLKLFVDMGKAVAQTLQSGLLMSIAMSALLAFLDPSGALIEALMNMALSLVPVIMGGISTILAALPKYLGAFVDIFSKIFQQLVPILLDVILLIVKEVPKILKESLPLLVEAFKGLVKVLAQALPEIFKSVGEIFTTLFSKENITMVVNALVDMVKILFSADNIKIFMGLINTLLGSFSTILTTIVSSLFSKDKNGKSLFDNLVDLVIGAIKEIFKPDNIRMLVNTLMTIFNALIDAVPDLILALVDALPDVIDALVGAIPIIVEALIKLLFSPKLWTAIGKMLLAVVKLWIVEITTMFKIVGAIGKGIGDGLKAVQQNMPEIQKSLNSFFTKTVPDFFTKFLPQAFHKIMNAVFDFISGMFNIASPLFAEGGVLHPLKGFFDGLKEFFINIKSIFAKDGALGVLKYFFDSIKETFRSIFESIGTFFTYIGDRGFLGVIEDFQKGVVQRNLDIWSAGGKSGQTKEQKEDLMAQVIEIDKNKNASSRMNVDAYNKSNDALEMTKMMVADLRQRGKAITDEDVAKILESNAETLRKIADKTISNTDKIAEGNKIYKSFGFAEIRRR